MLDSVRDVVPELVSVIDCAALLVPTFVVPKVRLEGESETLPLVPLPIRLTSCGLLRSLSLMVSVPPLTDPDEGVNVSVTVQLPPLSTVPWQVQEVTLK